jgi:hypothetical protein
MAIDRVKASAILDGSVTSADLDTNIDIAGTLDVTGTLTADSAGSVAGTFGIGTTSPGQTLEVNTGNDSNGIRIRRFSGSYYSDIVHTSSPEGLKFMVGNGSSVTERLRILGSGGITFNGDTAAANALDDYEEGVYTASITASSGSITLGYNQLKYTKIGRLVTVMGLLYVSSVSSPIGYATFNLPFTVSSGDNYSNRSAGTSHGSSWVSLNANQVDIVATESNSIAYFTDVSSSTATSASIATQFQAGTEFFVTFTYHTD